MLHALAVPYRDHDLKQCSPTIVKDSGTEIRFDTLPITFGEFVRNTSINLGIEPIYYHFEVINITLIDPITKEEISFVHSYSLEALPDCLVLIYSSTVEDCILQKSHLSSEIIQEAFQDL